MVTNSLPMDVLEYLNVKSLYFLSKVIIYIPTDDAYMIKHMSFCLGRNYQ